MALNITMVAESVKNEAENYKREFDGIQKAKEIELKEARENFKEGSKMLTDKLQSVQSACDSALTKLKIETADRALRDIEALREQELFRVQSINEPLLAKIRAISNIPMTALELKAIGAKYGVKGDYWANRALSDAAESNGIDPAEIGIESTFDTKMMVLDNLTEHLNNVIKYYGENNPLVPEEEKLKVNYVYFSDNVMERTKLIYDGKLNASSDSQKADKAYFTVMTQQTDIQKGIAISNVLRNAKGEVKNMLLCKLAEDSNISDMAAKFSGHYDEIARFKNGKAAEYREAEKAMQNILKMKDKTVIEQKAAELEENTFFGDMFAREQKVNADLWDILDDTKTA